jgi:TrmH family RNA methyltransferase
MLRKPMAPALQPVTSRQNPLVARFRDAARGETDLLLLDGAHLVAEALSAGLRVREAVIASTAAAHPEIFALTARLTSQGVPLAAASAAVMGALSPVRSPSSIVALAERPADDDARAYRGTPLLIVAVDVQDPGNLGAIARVAEAGGATALVAAGMSADPFGWKALRGSMGSALRLPILRRPDAAAAASEARRHGCRLLATVPRSGRSIFDADLSGAVAILIGGEGQGLSASLIDIADDLVTIPMHEPVESLNAAVTAGLVVYEALRQRNSKVKS